MQNGKQKLALTVLLFGLSGFAFLLIDSHNASSAARLTPLALETPLDALIPFAPSFVFAYFLYFPWLLLPLLILRHQADFYRALAAFMLLQLSAAFVFLVYPSRMIRPSFVPEGLAGDLVRAIYALDPGWNVFPSLHVGHSVLVALIYWQYRRDFFPIAAAGAGLIAVSTVLIKQHYLLDLPAGALLASACFYTAQLLPSANALRAPALALR